MNRRLFIYQIFRSVVYLVNMILIGMQIYLAYDMWRDAAAIQNQENSGQELVKVIKDHKIKAVAVFIGALLTLLWVILYFRQIWVYKEMKVMIEQEVHQKQ